MPSADQHRNKAERNRHFLNCVSLNDFPEWVAVAAFYTADFFAQFQPEDVEREIVKNRLVQIEQYVSSLPA